MGLNSVKSILLCWLGSADVRASRGELAVGSGPIAQALEARQYDQVLLICNQPPAQGEAYAAWLRGRTTAQIDLNLQPLTSPTNFGEIYEAAVSAISDVIQIGRAS